MRPIVLVLALSALVVAAVVAAPPPAPALAADRSANRAAASSTGKAAPAFDDYRLVIDRNIFSRDRTRPSAYRPPSDSHSSTRAGDSEMILSGVASQDGAMIAFFEDDQTAATTRLAVGQRIRGGAIAGISLDGVDYQTSSGLRRVAIGQTLSGTPAVPLATTSPASQPSDSAAAPTAGASSGTGDKSVDDIAERMRKRRLAELGAQASSQPTTQESSNVGSSSDSTPASSPSSSPSTPSSTGSVEP